MRTFIASFLFFVSSTCIAQVAPTASGNVLAYDVFNAKQGFLQTEITFQPNKEQRILKLNIEQNGDRVYTLLDGKDFGVYNKFFARTSNRGRSIDSNVQFELLPKNQKIEVGTEWEYSRTGAAGNSECGNFSTVYQNKAKQGPDVTIKIDGMDVSIKTLAVETRTQPTFTRADCTSGREERVYLYSSELNEIVMDQAIEYMTGDKTIRNGGYKWILKSITTGAGQAAK